MTENVTSSSGFKKSDQKKPKSRIPAFKMLVSALKFATQNAAHRDKLVRRAMPKTMLCQLINKMYTEIFFPLARSSEGNNKVEWMQMVYDYLL